MRERGDALPSAPLPPGRFLDGPGPQPWVSDELVGEPAELWTRCHEQREATGLRPVLFSWFSLCGAIESPEHIGRIDLDAELRSVWREERAFFQSFAEEPSGPDDVELLPSFDEWPGLAPAVPADPASPDPDAVATAAVRRLLERKRLDGCRLLLVPAERDADIPALIGWGAETAVDLMCALLRSWEDRFGTRVVGFQGSRIWVSVARPPRTVDHATHVGLEHFLTGTDTMREFTPFTECAAGLVGSRLWEFWWD